MKWAKLLRRWTMRTIHAAVLGAALLGGSKTAFAQTPAAAANNSAIRPHYTKSKSFDLPVRMDPEFRQTLKEIRLYVKTPTGQWSLQEQVAPYVDKFKCSVPADGEYWYTLATVDKTGRMNPVDVITEPPSQKVVVDTTPPQIHVQVTPGAGGEVTLRCTVVDANPDLSTLRAVCHTDVGDIPLEAAGEPGIYRIRGPEMLRHQVIVTVRDRSGNEGTERVSLRELAGAAAPSKGPAETAQTVQRIEPKNSAPIAPEPLPGRIDNPGLNGGNRPELPSVPPTGTSPTLPPTLPAMQPDQPIKPAINLTEAPARTPGGPYQLINTTHASIDYRIDHVGPSGVGKVEIFMTPDNGQTWHRVMEDANKRSPAEINLPGEGVYGIRIAVANGNGFGGKAPVRGDAPHCTIEVDTTAPFVQLRSADLLASAGQIEIHWNAADKNLGAEPVTLHYRTRPDEPWKLIARNLKNDGTHRWAFPRDVGSQFFFKVEVTDQAGNVASAASHQPTTIDMTEPHATVLGVSGSGVVGPR